MATEPLLRGRRAVVVYFCQRWQMRSAVLTRGKEERSGSEEVGRDSIRERALKSSEQEWRETRSVV
jgi:hypothetical protein